MILNVRTLLSVGITALLLFLVLLMPARVALSLTGMDSLLGYQDARGSIWGARLHGARLRGQPVGSMDLSISPFALLSGSFNADVRFSGGGRQGSFSLLKGATTEIKSLDLALDVSAVFGPAALSGVLSVRDAALSYEGARCTSGSGTIRTNILENGFSAIGMAGPLLAGQLGCTDGTVSFSLGGESDLLQISAIGRVTGAGQPDADILLTFKDPDIVTPDLKSALEFAGLRESNEGWRGQLNMDIR